MDESGFLGPPTRNAPRPAIRRRAPSNDESLVLASLDYARHGLIILDRERRVRLISKPAALMLGIPANLRDSGIPIMTMLAESRSLDAGALQVLAASFGNHPSVEAREMLISVPSPGHKPARVLAIDLRAVRHRGYIVSLADVTQTQATQDWLLEHASTEPITGLWNRQHFMLMLRDRLETYPPHPTTLLLLNLRRFRNLNETLGAHAGDQVLRLMAGRITSLLRDEDMVARFAGDEFAVVVGGIQDSAGAQAMALRLCEIAARPLMIEETALEIGVCIGIARAPDNANSADALLNNAALALAAAQSDNGNAIRSFDPKLDEQARTRRMLEQDLRNAVQNDEFVLYYQPQIELSSHRVTGFEALIRWRHPVRGMVPPTLFIPLAEEIGLIGTIGAWVLHTACKAALHWPDDITVAVNASPLQVEAPGFDDVVRTALLESGLPGERLEVEVTENMLLHDNGLVYAALHALRDMRVRLVLDDFGTGYASLSQLSRFHFDKLKIDRSFVSSPGHASGHEAIVRAIAALGSSLGIPTTAEGVETEVQLELIRTNGCTSVQGYYFSQPVPEEAIPALLEKLSKCEAPALVIS